MLQTPNFPGPWGAYSAPPQTIADGEGARCPSLLSALRASFLRVSGSNPTMIDFKCRSIGYIMKFVFSENGENGLGDEGADGAMPPL